MMGVLTCNCLNVSVHYKGDLWTEKPLSSNHIFPEGAADRLMNQPLCEVELDVAGILVEYRVLVLTRTVGDWVIHTCSNCETDVHISHLVKEHSRVFVTNHLEANGDKLRSTDEYSKVFKIVLKGDLETAEVDAFRRKRVSSMTFGKEDQTFSKIHSQMKDFLNHEQLAMEERIRKYDEEQRSAFQELQGKTHKDRALLFAAINRAAETKVNTCTANTTGDRVGPGINKPSVTIITSPIPSVQQRPSPKKHVTLVAAPKHSSPAADDTINMHESPLDVPDQEVEDRRDNLEEDTADFFALEEYASEDGRPGPERSAFMQSSDEETSTDDSSYQEDSTLNNMHVMASSLPVAMLTTRRRTQEDIHNVGDQFDPQEVGASIRALALSVQDTGMFGDLPKPRIDCRPYAR